MRRDFVRSLIVIVISTVTLGLIYPLVITGLSQVAFSSQADGSLVTRNGHTVGSSLIAQSFTGSRYFHPRPSAVAYNAAGTGGDNLGPNSKALYAAVAKNLAAVLKLERPYNPGLTAAGVPVDAVTASFSGVDPLISPAYADLQAPRIAAVRGVPLAAVKHLISQNTAGRFLGLFGEPGVNVLELNLALDRIAS
jgi:potassium-transporting ATPase KdpC subunit